MSQALPLKEKYIKDPNLLQEAITRHFSEYVDRVVAKGNKIMKKNFTLQRNNIQGNDKWAGLADSTLDYRATRFNLAPGSPIHINTGNLQRNNRGLVRTDTIVEVINEALSYDGNDIPYPHLLNEGLTGKRGGGLQPTKGVREFLELPWQLEDKDLVRKYGEWDRFVKELKQEIWNPAYL